MIDVMGCGGNLERIDFELSKLQNISSLAFVQKIVKTL
jgi:hypothetical protein